MTQQPSGPDVPDGGSQRGTRSDVDDLNVTPGVAGPSGTGERTERGGDADAKTGETEDTT